MIPVRDCPGIEPQADGTCANCGNRVAEYYRSALGTRRWEHKRGSVAGSESAHHGSLAAAQKRAQNRSHDSARIRELEAALALEQRWHERDVMALLRTIDAKLDQLLGRGAWQPSHRRISDGGKPVREQRAAAGLPRRSRAGP